ncbi:ribonuclease T2 [Cocleimonas sp. KMM 6892]|uniref:ribonuclease T2 n=1 Tax=unclassified Cocleimonas TaxID=2639732 RepID=UPI002DB90DAF|nr:MULTISPECIES: ribonuclease T2 [unclassified Cocleimonas]MEB8433420.1 ribonuclease T2 [Cocleimonas sp. KMM 6892]MEC4716231.1 ribonuclease T2 [Cocleimonas sp. KMM 6895]MEC4745876.1 ribonuclease T2 [Cocleimonas sp. KMM 6896]
MGRSNMVRFNGMIKYLTLYSFCMVLFSASPAYAKKPNQCFEIQKSCPAFQSFRKKTNPGNVTVTEGNSYSIIQKSKKGTHYRVRIEGIDRQERWIDSRCGIKTDQCGISNNNKNALKTIVSKPGKTKAKSGQYLLALSWMPTFCESKSRKKECRSLGENRYDATHLSLHGLWPQPRANAYCGVSDTDKGIDRNKRWHLLEPLKLSHETVKKLAFVMPGYASNLHRHEWIKHGTCYGTDADTYYQHSIALTQKINESAVGRLLSKNIGRKVSLKQIRQSFDSSFGKGAGKKVDLRCDRKGRISELWINFTGVVTDKAAEDLDVSRLMKSAIDAGSTCFKGYVDRAG